MFEDNDIVGVAFERPMQVSEGYNFNFDSDEINILYAWGNDGDLSLNIHPNDQRVAVTMSLVALNDSDIDESQDSIGNNCFINILNFFSFCVYVQYVICGLAFYMCTYIFNFVAMFV